MDVRTLLRYLGTLHQLRYRDRWTRRQLDGYQAEALRRLREYAYARSPFYQRFHRGLMDRPLHELPVLTKPLLMEEFDELVTDRAVRLEEVRAHVDGADAGGPFRGRYRVNVSSGTSGSPGLFLYDPLEWLVVNASYGRAFFLAGPRISLRRHPRVASVTSNVPYHLSSQATASGAKWQMPVRRLSSAEPAEALVAALNDYQPEILLGYAFVYRVLADEQLAGRLRIAPDFIFSSAGVLTDQARRRIEAAWGRQPFNNYGVTESGTLASECTAHRGLHLFEDLVIFEVVDEQYRPVPPDVHGAKVLITRLFGRTQPLIRYELGDSVRLAEERCPCGRPFALVDHIQGRESEVFYFPSADGRKVPVMPMAFVEVLDPLPASGWQVIQETDRLVIRLGGVRDGLKIKSVEEAVMRTLVQHRAQVEAVRVQCVPEIPRDPSGKAPLFRPLVYP